jgi:hypothetical protein
MAKFIELLVRLIIVGIVSFFVLVCWEGYSVYSSFSREEKIESKSIITPTYRLEVNDGNRIDTVYIYKFK